MRHDSDFAAYLAARWPALVRTLTLLGLPQHVAEDVARSALAECRASWDRVRRADDVDAHVYRTVLDCRRDRLRQPWWEEPAPTGTTPPLDDEDDDGDGLVLRDLEAALDRLTPDLRVVLVLSRVAGLDEEQVAEVLELSPGVVARRLDRADAGLGGQDFRRASEAIDVLAPPSEAVLDRSGRPRRRLRPAVAVAALAVAVLAGLGTWAGTRAQDGPAPDPPNVTRVENAAGVSWWSRGVLHLRHVQLPLPGVVDLAEVDGGAVVGDEAGAVSFVAADGARTLLGHKVPQQPLVVSDEQPWVAWVDPERGSPELIVYDVGARRELARRALPIEGDRFATTQSHPIALDQDRVFYADQSGDWDWPLPDGAPARVRQSGLLDVRRAVRVSQPGPAAIKMVQPFFSIAFTRPGLGARISPDGTRVLTRVVLADGGASVRIYDARSGDRLWRGLRPWETVVAASLGPGDGVTYAVAHSGYLSATYELRTCHLDERACSTVVTVPQTSVPPVLPR